MERITLACEGGKCLFPNADFIRCGRTAFHLDLTTLGHGSGLDRLDLGRQFLDRLELVGALATGSPCRLNASAARGHDRDRLGAPDTAP